MSRPRSATSPRPDRGGALLSILRLLAPSTVRASASSCKRSACSCGVVAVTPDYRGQHARRRRTRRLRGRLVDELVEGGVAGRRLAGGVPRGAAARVPAVDVRRRRTAVDSGRPRPTRAGCRPSTRAGRRHAARRRRALGARLDRAGEGHADLFVQRARRSWRSCSGLRVRDGHKVLEVGAGTGYNAALLCHRLGAGRVTTVDVDPAIAARAVNTWRPCGYLPTCEAADGALGYPAATAVRPSAGNLFGVNDSVGVAGADGARRPHRDDVEPADRRRPGQAHDGEDGAGQGRVLAGRPFHAAARASAAGHRAAADAVARDWEQTRLPMSTLLRPREQFEFFAGLSLPGVRAVREHDGADPTAGEAGIALVHPDGSSVPPPEHAERARSPGQPRALWEVAEAAYVDECELGRRTRAPLRRDEIAEASARSYGSTPRTAAPRA